MTRSSFHYVCKASLLALLICVIGFGPSEEVFGKEEEANQKITTLTKEFYNRLSSNADAGRDNAREFLLHQSLLDRKAVAIRVAKDTNATVRALGIGTLLKDGCYDEAAASLAAHIVAGREDFSRYGYALAHTEDPKEADAVGRLYVTVNRRILNHLETYTSIERSNAVRFLRGIGTSSEVKGSSTEALKKRVEELEKDLGESSGKSVKTAPE
jgi:hypothetical protein